MRGRSCPLFVAVVAALTTCWFAPTAQANGRFPNATQLIAAPGDRAHFALRATYGLIQTFDGGATWAWVCEAAIGYRGTFDAAIIIAKDGTLVAGLPDGLSATADRGCTFPRALGPELVIDVARAAAGDERIIALSTSLSTSPSSPSDSGSTLHVSNDAAAWTKLSTIPLLRGQTVDVAPSDPMRVYVSGTRDGAGLFLRSTDGGATFNELPVDLVGGRAPFIAAIDPKNADVVYVRTDGGTVPDALLVTRDGGASFTTVVVPTRQLLGLALAPDGARIAIGGPDDGLFLSATDTFAFSKSSSIRVRCLTWTPDALYACTSRDADGFALGRSLDDGRTWTKFFDVPDLTEQRCAAPSTTNAKCAEAWQAVSAMIGEDPNAFVPDTSPVKPPAAQPSPAERAEGGCGRCGRTSARSDGRWWLIALGAAIARLASARQRR